MKSRPYLVFAFDRDREWLRFLLPLLLLVFYGWGWRSYVPGLIPVDPGLLGQWRYDAVASAIAGSEAIARLVVATTTQLTVVAAVIAAIYAVFVVVTRRKPQDRTVYGAFSVTVVVALLLIGFVDSAGLLGRDALYRLLDELLFEKTLGSLPGGDGMRDLRYAVVLTNVTSIMAGIVVLMAVCRLGSDFTPLPYEDAARRVAAETEAPVLARALLELRNLLFLGSSVLLAGLLAAKAWRSWPLGFCRSGTIPTTGTPPAPVANAFEWCTGGLFQPFSDKVTATVVFDAVSFSLILAVIFVPKAAALRHRAFVLAEAAGQKFGTKGFKEWQVERGLVWDDWRSNLSKLVAVLAPLWGTGAVAVIQALVDAVKKGSGAS